MIYGRRSILLVLGLALLLTVGMAVTAQAEEVPLSASISLDKQSVALAMGESITATVTVEGGVGPYSYDFNKYIVDKYAQTLHSDEGYGSASTVTFTPTFGNEGYVSVLVRDAEGKTASSESARFAIISSPDGIPLTVTANIDTRSVDIGQAQSVTATATASGGAEPYSYDFSWLIYAKGLRAWNDHHTQEGSSSTLIPGYGESGEVYVEARDANGRTGFTWTSLFTITGDSAPLTIDLSLDKDTVDATKGEGITASWVVSGGEPPYRYRLFWLIDAEGEATETVEASLAAGATSAAFNPTRGQWGRAMLEVTDSLGRPAQLNKQFVILDGSKVALTGNMQMDTMEVDLSKGESLTATAAVVGGTPPYQYDFVWTVSDGGEFSAYPSTWEEGKRSNFAPKFGKSGLVYLTITDAEGTTQRLSNPFMIMGDTTAPLVLSGSLSTKAADLGRQETVTATWSAIGGVYPYSYEVAWWVDQKKAQDSYPTGNTTAAFQPVSGREGFAAVTVKDSQGRLSYWGHEDLFAITGTPPAVVPGDANGDGTANVDDLACIVNYLLSRTPCPSMAGADASQGDGKVTMDDLLSIIDSLVGG